MIHISKSVKVHINIWVRGKNKIYGVIGNTFCSEQLQSEIYRPFVKKFPKKFLAFSNRDWARLGSKVIQQNRNFMPSDAQEA